MKHTSDIVSEAARRANTSRALAKDVVEAALEGITGSLLRGEAVHLRGLGVLSVGWHRMFQVHDVGSGGEAFRRYPRVTFRQTRTFKEQLKEANSDA